MLTLPPLKALRTFEVAARHASFTSAAEALNVTHGAVSRQINLLEEYLGQALFKRLPRGIELTPEGREFSQSVRVALNDISGAVEKIRHTDNDTEFLSISTLPGLASRWLFPRLPRFQKRFPDIKVRVSIKVRLVNFAAEEVDLAIRYGDGRWDDVFSKRLFGEESFPVCAPSLMKGKNGLKTPADLERFDLLHDHSNRYWATWLKLAGVDNVDPNKGQLIDDPNSLLQACIAGQGVALSMQPLVHEDIKAGRLIKPFDIDLPTDAAYYAVCPKRSIAVPKIKAMIDWLVEEADATKNS